MFVKLYNDDCLYAMNDKCVANKITGIFIYFILYFCILAIASHIPLN